MINRIHLQVPTSLANSEQVLSWFNQLNQPPISDIKIWWQCQTLLQEGFTNAVEHAHQNLPSETLIDIEAMRFSKHIEIRIWDYGSPFNLEQKLKEISEFEDNNGDRGRGLKIMSEMADKLSYERKNEQRNCLFIIKYY